MLSRLRTLLLILIASSIATTGLVHARELPGVTKVECNGTIHSDGDTDQSLGDTDKAMPHHHTTCHGQPLSMPKAVAVPFHYATAGLRLAADADPALPSAMVDPGLRPPTA